MGEGWGDAIATLIRQIEEHHKFKCVPLALLRAIADDRNGSDVYTMGAWAANNVRGIRNFPYSTNSTINPSTYKTLDKPGYWGVHAIGEVWAQFLFTMSQNLVSEYGFSETLFPPTNVSEPNDYYTHTFDSAKPTPLVPKHGNTLALQLIVDGMKLQPCRPSFFDARDAIIQADKLRTGGVNACTIWKSFASVGLGSDARVIGQTPWGGGVRTDGHQFPSGVCKKK
jgi:extracellular elastinolytic metalloproteinase